MTDIVERLRKGTGDGLRAWDFMNEAADEIERLHSVIDATANHWLALQHNHPIRWEGAIDGAMAAACAEIERLQAALHSISLATQNSSSTMHGIRADLRKALHWEKTDD